MNHVELHCELHKNDQVAVEILIAELSDFGFESFMETGSGLLAYIKEDRFNPQLITEFPEMVANTKIQYHWKTIEKKNWNEEWERDYPPVIINDQCIIRAPFHKTENQYAYEIIIEPKMSFGTGHHETTSLMVEMMLKHNFKHKSVLDIGSGTGILAILASKMMAKQVFAVDVDTWAYQNSVENIKKNKCHNIETLLGGMEVLTQEKFDVILANINRNILLADMDQYAKHVTHEGNIFFSGIYKRDMEILTNSAKEFGLKRIDYLEKNDWVALRFLKT